MVDNKHNEIQKLLDGIDPRPNEAVNRELRADLHDLAILLVEVRPRLNEVMQEAHKNIQNAEIGKMLEKSDEQDKNEKWNKQIKDNRIKVQTALDTMLVDLESKGTIKLPNNNKESRERRKRAESLLHDFIGHEITSEVAIIRYTKEDLQKNIEKIIMDFAFPNPLRDIRGIRGAGNDKPDERER